MKNKMIILAIYSAILTLASCRNEVYPQEVILSQCEELISAETKNRGGPNLSWEIVDSLPSGENVIIIKVQKLYNERKIGSRIITFCGVNPETDVVAYSSDRNRLNNILGLDK